MAARLERNGAFEERHPRRLAVIRNHHLHERHAPGVKLQLTSGSANNWSGSPTDASRPNVIAGPILPKDERTFDKNLNTAAFSLPPQGTWGNAPKDVFRGLGINNWDISMFKTFQLTERFKAQFRLRGLQHFQPHPVQRGGYEREV